MSCQVVVAKREATVFERMLGLLKPGMWGLLLAGCAAKSEPAVDAAADAREQANVRKVTLYVEGMIERQGITWPTWRNRVQEALAGLPGVASVEVDAKKDLCKVAYDPDRLTVEQMREAIRQQGFEGEVRDSAGGG